MPTFTYDQAVLLSRIVPNRTLPDALCLDYICSDCPAYNGTLDHRKCQFIAPYAGDYEAASRHARLDMRAQFPPEQYPELYVSYHHVHLTTRS